MHIFTPHVFFFDHPATQKVVTTAQISSAYASIPHDVLPCPNNTYSLEQLLQTCVDDVHCRTILAIGKDFTTKKFQDFLKTARVTIDTPQDQASALATQGLGYMRLNHDTHLLISSGDETSLLAAAKILSIYYDIIDGKRLHLYSQKISALLKDNGLTIASAESCSGGLIVKTLTDIPGSSSYVCGGICTYTASAKAKILGVVPDVISTYGIVSSATAHAMAKGAQKLFACTIALSTTGVAGPGKDSDGNPEGLVYIGIACNDKCTTYKYASTAHTLLLDRDCIRKGCVLFALDKLYTLLSSSNKQ